MNNAFYMLWYYLKSFVRVFLIKIMLTFTTFAALQCNYMF